MIDGWFRETRHAGYGQSFEIGETLYSKKTDHQDLAIFDTPALGRVLVLDGVVQTTEADEFYYHEMMTHLPILAHGAVRKVLIIGGGDGGALRETLKHRNIDQVTMVEIDASVVELCREYLPKLSNGAFDDSRTRLLIDDGTRFVAETDETFDIVIVDSTDPIGPSVELFGDAFYQDCRKVLGATGILIRQAGVPFFQKNEYAEAFERFSNIFGDCALSLVPVPTYCGGHMALVWGSDTPSHRQATLETLRGRYHSAKIETRYYNPEIHLGAFAIPNFMKAALAIA